jgi:hypothetical protein
MHDFELTLLESSNFVGLFKPLQNGFNRWHKNVSYEWLQTGKGTSSTRADKAPKLRRALAGEDLHRPVKQQIPQAHYWQLMADN